MAKTTTCNSIFKIEYMVVLKCGVWKERSCFSRYSLTFTVKVIKKGLELQISSFLIKDQI